MSGDTFPPPPPLPPTAGGITADGTGGVIPYKNPLALTAYYTGVFSIIPLAGFILGIIALVLGIKGWKAYKRTPQIRGQVHAWIGIIAGSLSILVHLGLTALIIFASVKH